MSGKINLKDLKVIFDLDDTLIMTMVKFNRAAFECGSLVVSALGWYAPYAPELIELQVRNDIDLTSTLGFGPQKYVTCWLQTYEMLCDKRALLPDKDVMHRLQKAALKPFIGKNDLVPGAIETVQALAKKGCELFMCTMGDKNVQLTKVNGAGLSIFFPDHRIHVVNKTKVDVLRQIAGDSPERTVMIGDSKKSDIKAAQENRIHPVHIDCPTKWSYNDVDESELGPYWQLSCIKEVPATLARILRGEVPS